MNQAVRKMLLYLFIVRKKICINMPVRAAVFISQQDILADGVKIRKLPLLFVIIIQKNRRRYIAVRAA